MLVKRAKQNPFDYETQRDLHNAYDDAARDYDFTVEKLRGNAEVLRDRMARAMKTIDKGNAESLNSFGELQSTGQEFDSLCGVLNAQAKMLAYFERLAKKDS